MLTQFYHLKIYTCHSVFVSVPEYDIAHPAKVTDKGHFLSHQLSEDDIRGITDNGDGIESRLHYNISAFGTHFNLHLKKNHKLLAPNMVVEVLGHKGKVLRRDKVRNCFYHGHSKNHHKSIAALSNCENLVREIKELFCGLLACLKQVGIGRKLDVK